MNKGVLIAVGAIVVIGVGAWWFMGRGSAPAAEPGASGSSQGGIQQLMAQGNARCTVSSETNGVTSGGTVYVADNRVRGDFTSTLPQTGPVESHMIVRDGFIYTWSSMAPQGMKMAVNNESEAGVSSDPQQPSPYEAQYSYECDAWSPDESQFTVPSTVTFMEFSAAAGAGASASGPSCAQCDMAPAGTARDQCRAALNCK